MSAPKAVWRISDLAFVLAGFAVVVSITCMVYVRKQVLALHQQLADVQRELSDAKAHAEAAAPAPSPIGTAGEEVDIPILPTELLAKIGAPVAKGDRVTVTAPAALYAAVRIDARSLTTEASMLPDAANQDGFVLEDVRPGGLAAKLGFQNGDKIKTVNGKPFANTAEVVDVWESLGDAPKSISFGIVRAEKPMTIDVELAP